jgi:hypothetical protein
VCGKAAHGLCSGADARNIFLYCGIRCLFCFLSSMSFFLLCVNDLSRRAPVPSFCDVKVVGQPRDAKPFACPRLALLGSALVPRFNWVFGVVCAHSTHTYTQIHMGGGVLF